MSGGNLALIYRLFFLYIEPVATAVGAYYAHFKQHDYLKLTVPPLLALPASTTSPSVQETIVLTQLANMYFVFALTEALILRASTDSKVWRTLLFSLLVADLGHVYSVSPMGLSVYWRFWDWNAIYWGNLGFVYVGALLRICYLAGVGVNLPARSSSRRKQNTL